MSEPLQVQVQVSGCGTALYNGPLQDVLSYVISGLLLKDGRRGMGAWDEAMAGSCWFTVY